jgi:hypothetical protein
MNDLLQPGQHPDADQLSAFAEHALPPHERQEMLAHLAACPDCRALIYLAQQADPIETTLPQAVTTGRPMFAGWFSGWRLAVPTAAIACLILLSFYLRKTSTPRIQTTPITTATTTQPKAQLPSSPNKPLIAAASPGRVRPRTAHTLRHENAQLNAITLSADASVPAAIIPAAPASASSAPITPPPAVQEAQATPQASVRGAIISIPTLNIHPSNNLSGGGITGTVTDPQGKVIVKAQVTATNTDTGVEVKTLTTSEGVYSFNNLPVGNYNVEVVAKGFQRLLQENVNVDNASMFAMNTKLTIGGENTTITITDAPPYLDASDATLGGTIENELYASLPLSMQGGPRNSTAFQYLMPGVQENTANATNQGATAGSSGIYGGTGQNNLNANYVEGVPVSNIAAQGSGTAIANAGTPIAIDKVLTGANAAGLGVGKPLPTLPSKLPALAVVESGSRTVALDTGGTLFRSEDAGVTWHPVPAQWQGRALSLRVTQPQSAAQPAAAPNSSSTVGATPQTQALASLAPAFELTTDTGVIYTSSDGQTWQRK